MILRVLHDNEKVKHYLNYDISDNLKNNYLPFYKYRLVKNSDLDYLTKTSIIKQFPEKHPIFYIIKND